MNKKRALKLSLDFVMTVLMLFAFAYQLTENTLHEILGIALFLLFVLHHLLNRNWHKALFMGRYRAMRIAFVVVNALLLLAMITMTITGILLSRDLFAFLHLSSGFLTRQLHTFSSYWGLILLSVHLGLHWKMVLTATRKALGIKGPNTLRAIIARALAALIATAGVAAFLNLKIADTLFLHSAFGFWAADNLWLPVAHFAVMGLCVCATYYIAKFAQSLKKRRHRK